VGAPTAIDDVLADLVDEYDRLETILSSLSTEQWTTPSGAPGWSIGDVVLHLALTEEAVIDTLTRPDSGWTERDRPLDAVVDDEVRDAGLSGPAAFERWRAARRASVVALAHADPSTTVRWAAAPLRPRTLATTRLAEHWAHGLDITEPLDIEFPDTDRLKHIAWLGHATLPYAMRIAGLQPQPIFCALTGPGGTNWTFGPPDAASSITGEAGVFCRVGARRVPAARSGLITRGPHAADALRVLRNYAA
jgi:uncharacterized protein (TIGR03084 family)